MLSIEIAATITSDVPFEADGAFEALAAWSAAAVVPVVVFAESALDVDPASVVLVAPAVAAAVLVESLLVGSVPAVPVLPEVVEAGVVLPPSAWSTS
jgi:hypothetical protein